MTQDQLQQLLTDFRHQLHQHPELSGQEADTAQRVADFLQDTAPDHVYKNIAGNGLAVVYDSGQPGPKVMFRCELDALPIAETNALAYASATANVSHKCGHDGHMAIMCGLAYLLAEDRPAKGKVILLFQPAEETGEGAKQILQGPSWQEIQPDYLFALHNIPGMTKHVLCSRPGIFAAASKGVTITLTGHTAHAAHPEQGKSPAAALSYLIDYLSKLPQQSSAFHDFTLVTIIHALLGEVAFGITPGYAELRATLRSYRNEDMHTLTRLVAEAVQQQAQKYGLSFTIAEQDVFTAVVNDAEAHAYLEQAALAADLSLELMPQPMRWSEDFGYFSPHCKTTFFGLGAGEAQPVLHHPAYDFPDDIILTGSRMFTEIARRILA